MEIKSPIKGMIKPLSSLKDGVFSECMLGDGLVIQQTDGNIYAPISGKAVTVFDTGHAYGFVGKDGTSVLIHIGIDTVNLNGKGFNPLIKQGKKVKQGDLIAKVDLDEISNKVPNTDVIIIILSESKTKISWKSEGEVDINTTILEVN